jgi:Cdc6-like AAA superfamily ATPase
MSISTLISSKKENNSKNNLKDSEVFDPSCDLSTDLMYERKELYQIGKQFLEFIQEDYKRHRAILGDKGSGKTALVRFTMKELQKNFTIKWYYINCAEADTSYKIAKKIIVEKKRLDIYKTVNNLISSINMNVFNSDVRVGLRALR